MKIALAHKRLDLKGGTEKDFYRTAEGLRDLGHEVHLFCSEFGVEPPRGTVAHWVPVLPLGRTARLWSYALLAPRIIGKWHCEVLVSFGRMLSADIVRSGGGSHRGFLERTGAQGGLGRRLWQRLSPYHQSVLAIERRQFQPGGFRRVIAVSEEVKRDLVHQYAVPRERIAVLYNGVDQRRFHPGLRDRFRARIRARWQIPHESPLVLFVGSGFRRKGLDILLSAWSAPTLSKAYLLVIGDDGRSSAYKARARSVAGERIVFAGRQEDVENFYAAADVVALPSLQEAFGNVVLESLAAGVPVLVSRQAGAAELLTGALAEGIVDRLDDREELVGKLVKLIARCADPSLAAEARVLGEEFSWERHFRELEALILEIRNVEPPGQARGAPSSPPVGRNPEQEPLAKSGDRVEGSNTVENFPDFICHKLGDALIWVAPKYAAPADVALLADADRLFQGLGCEIIKDQRKIKVARIRIKLGGRNRALYLKRYNAFSWRIPLGSLFRRSGAVKALRGAGVLSSARIAGAKPVAAVESRRWGMVTKSFFFTEEIAEGKTIDAYWRDNLVSLGGREGFRRRRSFLRAVACLFRSLHSQRVYHGDLKDVNIIVVAGEPGQIDCFFLLDLEGIRRYVRLSRRRRVKNLVQLNRTFGRYVRSSDKMYFLKEYAAAAYSDPREIRRWAIQVLGRSSRLDRRKFASGRVSD